MGSGRHAAHSAHLPGRLSRPASHRRGLRLLAAAGGLALTGVTVLAMAPAHADTATVDAQLSLSGVATKDSVLGGTTVGVHPGDTVDFQASAVPTAGLSNIPALGSVLGGALSTLTSSQFQVVVDFGAAVPGVGGQTVTLGGPSSGKCRGAADQPVTFPKAGTYSFTWTVQNVATGLLGCTQNGLGSTTLDQLRQAGIAINASNQWVGKIVVATDPPQGGLSVQLPGLGASPSLPIVGKLPGASLPPVVTPTLPAGGLTLPGLGALTGAAGGTHSAGSGATRSSGAASGYTPPGLTIPEEVVPQGYGNGGGGNGAGLVAGGAGGLGTGGLGAGGLGADSAQAHRVNSAAAAAHPSPAASATPTRAELAAGTTTSDLGKQLPRLLAIVAIIGLALTTGIYAKAYLLHHK